MAKKEKRFQVVHEENITLMYGATILLDTMTGVLYLQTVYSSSVALTPLLDSDGKPTRWDITKLPESF